MLEGEVIDQLPSFSKRSRWFLEHRSDLAHHIACMETGPGEGHTHRLLAIPSLNRLLQVLRYLLDENEFLSAYGTARCLGCTGTGRGCGASHQTGWTALVTRCLETVAACGRPD